MCLYPIHPNTVKIAETDIKAFKVLEREGLSIFQYTPYVLGETKQVSFFTDFHDRKFKTGKIHQSVHEGLHSFRTKSKAIKEARDNAFHYPSFVVEVTIPKGTPYIIGDDNDIVSLQITVGKAVYGTRDSLKFRKVFNGEESKISKSRKTKAA